MESPKHLHNRERVRLMQLGELQSGEKVFDRPRSHLSENETLRKYLPLALARINPRGEAFVVETVDFEEEIGESNCVETEEGDEIVYAQRPGRAGHTRFVKNRQPSKASELTVILKKVEEGYIVITAFVGPKAEKEPWDQQATAEAHEFWSNHALVWGSTEVLPGSETITPDDSKLR